MRYFWRTKRLVRPLIPVYFAVRDIGNWLKAAALQRLKGLPGNGRAAPKLPLAVLKREYMERSLDEIADTFILYRIIGNDLPPRHRIGQAYSNLEFILENERPLSDCEKKWVINRIVDKDQESAIIGLLQKYNRPFIHIPYEQAKYRKTGWSIGNFPEPAFLASAAYHALDPEARMRVIMELYKYKNNYVMNNNGARECRAPRWANSGKMDPPLGWKLFSYRSSLGKNSKGRKGPAIHQLFCCADDPGS